MPWSGGAGEKPGGRFMCWQRVVFKSLFLGLYARRTHMTMNTHTYTDTQRGRSKSRPDTHINTNTILIRNQSERTGALPVPGWEPCPPCLSAQVLHRPGCPDALGWGLYPDQRVFLDGEPHRRRAEERQAVREGAGRRGDQNASSSLVLVLKWPQARPGTDGLFLMLSWRSGEREKEKINTITVRNLKINQKTYKINSLLLRVRLAPAAKGKQRTTGLGDNSQSQKGGHSSHPPAQSWKVLQSLPGT